MAFRGEGFTGEDRCNSTTPITGDHATSAGGKVLAEYEIDPLGVYTLARKYIYAGDQRIAMVDDEGDVYYYLNDHLGSARVVVNEQTGNADNVYSRYLAFGADDGSSVTTDQPFPLHR